MPDRESVFEKERERERGDKRRLGPFVPMSKNCFPKL